MLHHQLNRYEDTASVLITVEKGMIKKAWISDALILYEILS